METLGGNRWSFSTWKRSPSMQRTAAWGPRSGEGSFLKVSVRARLTQASGSPGWGENPPEAGG